MLPYISEFLGTMLLIILGDGVVANVTLNKSGMKGAGSIQITFAWGLAVMIPACIFGAASGASFNPALTLALAHGRKLCVEHGARLYSCTVCPVRLWEQLLYICCSRHSLMLPRKQEPSWVYSVLHHRFPIPGLTCSAKQWEPLCLYLPSKGWQMCRDLQMDLENSLYLESSCLSVCLWAD